MYYTNYSNFVGQGKQHYKVDMQFQITHKMPCSCGPQAECHCRGPCLSSQNIPHTFDMLVTENYFFNTLEINSPNIKPFWSWKHLKIKPVGTLCLTLNFLSLRDLPIGQMSWLAVLERSNPCRSWKMVSQHSSSREKKQRCDLPIGSHLVLLNQHMQIMIIMPTPSLLRLKQLVYETQVETNILATCCNVISMAMKRNRETEQTLPLVTSHHCTVLNKWFLYCERIKRIERE